MGNVTAGELARRMGLPISKLCCGYVTPTLKLNIPAQLFCMS